MQLPLPIRPKTIPSKTWDHFLEDYYIPYLQKNYQRILNTGVSLVDEVYFEKVLNKLFSEYHGLSGLGFWGALIGAVVGAIPSAVGTIAQYKLGKDTLKLQKQTLENQKETEAREAALRQKTLEVQMEQQRSQPSVMNRAVDVVSGISGYLPFAGMAVMGLILLLRRRK